MSQDPKFEQLYLRFHPSLLSFAIYLTGSKVDAAELVNDVFLAVWEKRHTLSIDDNLKSYLFKAVKNRSANFHKKAKLDTVGILPNDKRSSLRADLPLEEKENAYQLNLILQSLPPKCKQVFVMSRMDGLKNKEIATLLDISIKTVENQMTKALKIFKEKIKTT